MSKQERTAIRAWKSLTRKNWKQSIRDRLIKSLLAVSVVMCLFTGTFFILSAYSLSTVVKYTPFSACERVLPIAAAINRSFR